MDILLPKSLNEKIWFLKIVGLNQQNISKLVINRRLFEINFSMHLMYASRKGWREIEKEGESNRRKKKEMKEKRKTVVFTAQCSLKSESLYPMSKVEHIIFKPCKHFITLYNMHYQMPNILWILSGNIWKNERLVGYSALKCWIKWNLKSQDH